MKVFAAPGRVSDALRSWPDSPTPLTLAGVAHRWTSTPDQDCSRPAHTPREDPCSARLGWCGWSPALPRRQVEVLEPQIAIRVRALMLPRSSHRGGVEVDDGGIVDGRGQGFLGLGDPGQGTAASEMTSLDVPLRPEGSPVAGEDRVEGALVAVEEAMPASNWSAFSLIRCERQRPASITRTPELKYGVFGATPISAQGRPAGAAAHGTTGSRTAPSTQPLRSVSQSSSSGCRTATSESM